MRISGKAWRAYAISGAAAVALVSLWFALRSAGDATMGQILDYAVAVGTIGAVVVALGIALKADRDARKREKRSELAQVRADLDETRRLLYMARVIAQDGEPVPAQIRATLLNALLHHSAVLEWSQAMDLDRMLSKPSTPSATGLRSPVREIDLTIKVVDDILNDDEKLATPREPKRPKSVLADLSEEMGVPPEFMGGPAQEPDSTPPNPEAD